MRSATTTSTIDRTVRWQVDHARVLGLRAEVQVLAEPSLLDVGLSHLRLLEATLSRLLPMSELNRFNHHADQWVAVSDDLYHALRRSIDLYRDTDGLCDPTVSPGTTEHDTPLGVCLSADHLARLHNGVRLDLSAIAAGLSADRTVDALVGRGAQAVQVTIGHTTRVAGHHPDGGWTVHLSHPVSGRPLGEHHLERGAITTAVGPAGGCWSTSRAARQIIDPRTSSPVVTDVLGAIVAADDAAAAEALARAAIIAGSAGAERVLRTANDAWLITGDGVTALR